MKINSKGAALVLVLIIFAALSVLGTAVLGVSLSETKQVVNQGNKTQAYYLARSGADTTAKYILRNPETAQTLVSVPKSAANSHFTNGTFEVDVKPGATANDVIVEGTGTVAGISSKVEVLLTRLSAQLIIDKTIYSNQHLNISGMDVDGDIQSGEDIQFRTSGSNPYTGNATPFSPRTIKLNAFPTPTHKSDLEIKNSSVVIDSSGSYENISIGQNGKLTVVTGGNVIQLVVVDSLIIDSNLEIDASGGGRLELYINNGINNSDMTITTKGTINNTEPKNLFVYLKDGSKLEIQANMILNGYVLGPRATVEVQSAQSTINGAIMAYLVVKNVQGNPPNGAVNFVPLPTGIEYGDNIIEYRIFEWRK